MTQETGSVLSDEDVERLLDEFYRERPHPMQEQLMKAFRQYRDKHGVWPPVVLREFGLVPQMMYRRH